MSTVADMFQICTQERLLDTEEVLRIVITSLAALWHARLTRSKALNGEFQISSRHFYAEH